MCLDDICFNVGAENPLLGSTVLYSSKTIEEKPTIAFVTDLLATAADSGHQKSQTQNQKSICKMKSQTQKSKIDLRTKKSL